LDWEDALDKAAEVLAGVKSERIGFLASPSSTLEEAHLLARLAAHLETSNIDHRVGRRDFSGQDNDPVYPWLGCDIAALEDQGAILVVGSNIRHEAPILAHRLRKASLRGAKISFANSSRYEYFFKVDSYLDGSGLLELLAGVAVAASTKKLPATISALCKGIKPSDAQKNVAAALAQADEGIVLLGNIATRHGSFAALRDLSAYISAETGAKLGFLSEGANSAGAHLAGVLPHRGLGGEPRAATGLCAAEMLNSKLDALVLMNLEPGADLASVGKRQFVIALTPFDSESLRESADLLLPIGTFAESSGTYVNVAGTWQSFAGVASPVGEARPAWKVLRVLGNLLNASGFDYVTSEDVRDEIAGELGEVVPNNEIQSSTKHALPNGADAPDSEIDIPLYAVDGLVRRANALQMTPEAKRIKDSSG
jgi:NADH-quinone oxidoreductase subunit G